ncbi:DUF3710 domain-containing protein [Kribbella jejuensis]|uniref:Uncharacterized protein DUF3710 n=1 Tax=Kribbella jejuensis TaxID=236068 RepID=A0A542D9B7_9ACTN|nr:DUF3710 domain-containing protein [Kribbella jejuensis]TQI99672.1 uncharacterized protein DUF3710 [Kribbella jejuensis]
MIFRRKGKNDEPETSETVEEAESNRPDARAEGPFDSAEVEAADLEADDRIDLGALRVAGMPGMELGLQVDEQSGVVQAVLLMLDDSALELRAFAAPKTTGIWDEVRQEIVGEAAKMGGTATETEGPFGTELQLVVPVEDPEGQVFSQTSRVIGVDGPRWLLRATVLGRAAVEPDAAEPMIDTLRNVIVVRGNEPMAVRESLPLRLPEGAQPNDAEQA